MINPRIHLELPVNLAYLSVIGSAIHALLNTENMMNDTAEKIRLAVHEACANIIDHAHPKENSQYISVILLLDQQTAQFRADLFDMGRAFTPPPGNSAAIWQRSIQESGTRYRLESVSEPTLEQDRGRGLFLMQQLMDHISCLVTEDGNHWQLIKQYETAVVPTRCSAEVKSK
ncbi:MAG: ATP-binding protein [Anaerolineales bacterium]|nr:ATP-binding protein [Anaerolineales bacterium]